MVTSVKGYEPMAVGVGGHAGFSEFLMKCRFPSFFAYGMTVISETAMFLYDTMSSTPGTLRLCIKMGVYLSAQPVLVI